MEEEVIFGPWGSVAVHRRPVPIATTVQVGIVLTGTTEELMR
jgi:hypothetical protein